MRRAHYSFVMLVSLLACTRQRSGGNSSPDPNHISENVPRVSADVTQAPFKSIGRISPDCTGTLIGRNLILTSARCIVDAEGHAHSGVITFDPSYQDGTSADTAWLVEAWIGSLAPARDPYSEWAIAVISKPLGEKYGYVALAQEAISSSLPQIITFAGYATEFNNGQKQFMQEGCALRKFSQERLLHDCSGTTTFSGAPFISHRTGKPEIVAISVANSLDENATASEMTVDESKIAISNERFLAAATELLAYASQEKFPESITDAEYVKNLQPGPNQTSVPPQERETETTSEVTVDEGVDNSIPRSVDQPIPVETPEAPVPEPITLPVESGPVTPIVAMTKRSCLAPGGFAAPKVYRPFDFVQWLTSIETAGVIESQAMLIRSSAAQLQQIFGAQAWAAANAALTSQIFTGASDMQQLSATVREQAPLSYASSLYRSYVDVCSGTYDLSITMTKSESQESILLGSIWQSILYIEAILFVE